MRAIPRKKNSAYNLKENKGNIDIHNKSSNTPLEVAAMLGDINTVKALIAEAKTPNDKEKKYKIALALAAGNKYGGMVKKLIKTLIKEDGRWRGGNSIHILFAIDKDYSEVVTYLIKEKRR